MMSEYVLIIIHYNNSLRTHRYFLNLPPACPGSLYPPESCSAVDLPDKTGLRCCCVHQQVSLTICFPRPGGKLYLSSLFRRSTVSGFNIIEDSR